MEAAQTSRPFADELAALDAVSHPRPNCAPCAGSPSAAPSRAALAASFPDYAARAAGAARAPARAPA
uniref:Uncharacterized protein n=1 Tax=Phenylobacterium glaciei TaxID=2803784 RepID=A0A974P4E7_9CAUL|nr:hypothetical protein JKL49_02310 [Phenylobacterium glaciei]